MKKRKLKLSEFQEHLNEWDRLNAPKVKNNFVDPSPVIPPTFKQLFGYEVFLTDFGAQPDGTVELIPG